MKRLFLYLAVGAAMVAGMLLAVRRLNTRLAELRSDVATIRGDTGDVMSSATYQRFQARREAVAAMQDELRALARAESAFVADSGRPTAFLPPAYAFKKAAGNIGPYIRIEPHGWSAMISNAGTSMRCTLRAALDTVAGTYHPGEPDCRSESGEAWDAALTAQAASRPPESSEHVPAVASPAQAPSLRKHRDWGPINNTPPPLPWIVKDECPGEYCSFGRWAACSTVVAHREKRAESPPAFTIQRGEEFTALTGDVHVNVAGMVVFRHAYSNPGDEGGPPVDSIRFTPADTLYVLNAQSEGYLTWYYRGRAATGYQFWIGAPFIPGEAEPTDTAVMIRAPQEVWWVRVRNGAGQEGWVQYDYRKMARDDRMDERSRCLQTAKG